MDCVSDEAVYSFTAAAVHAPSSSCWKLTETEPSLFRAPPTQGLSRGKGPIGSTTASIPVWESIGGEWTAPPDAKLQQSIRPLQNRRTVCPVGQMNYSRDQPASHHIKKKTRELQRTSCIRLWVYTYSLQLYLRKSVGLSVLRPHLCFDQSF